MIGRPRKPPARAPAPAPAPDRRFGEFAYRVHERSKHERNYLAAGRGSPTDKNVRTYTVTTAGTLTVNPPCTEAEALVLLKARFGGEGVRVEIIEAFDETDSRKRGET